MKDSPLDVIIDGSQSPLHRSVALDQKLGKIVSHTYVSAESLNAGTEPPRPCLSVLSVLSFGLGKVYSRSCKYRQT